MVGRNSEDQGSPAGGSDGSVGSLQRIGVAKGRAILDALPQEVQDQFTNLTKKQTLTRKKVSNLVSQTKQELRNTDSIRRSKIHEKYVKSMLAARLEVACQHKTTLDNLHFDIIGIIGEVDAGPEEGQQWAAVQDYIATFQNKWEEYNLEITEFTDYLGQMDGNFVEEQDEETGDGRIPAQGRQPKWRPKQGMDPGQIMEDISKSEWRIYLEKFESYAIASTEDGIRLKYS